MSKTSRPSDCIYRLVELFQFEQDFFRKVEGLLDEGVDPDELQKTDAWKSAMDFCREKLADWNKTDLAANYIVLFLTLFGIRERLVQKGVTKDDGTLERDRKIIDEVFGFGMKTDDGPEGNWWEN